jgi:metal-responsive CopG/Arc/MetJ family transcriptional regulator
MKRHYDFSKGVRGAFFDPIPPGKTRITIRIDDEILDWFRDKADEMGGGSYQTMINDALREYIRRSDDSIEEKLRHVVREELARYRTKRRTK